MKILHDLRCMMVRNRKAEYAFKANKFAVPAQTQFRCVSVKTKRTVLYI